jgi:Zn2+/Cd2+-exporting ATPase
LSDDLKRLPALVRLSRRTRFVINSNLAFGVSFIIVGWSIALTGLIVPTLAAFLHFAGSLIVVFNSARLVRHGEELPHHTGDVT